MSFLSHVLFNNTYTPPPVATTRRHLTGWTKLPSYEAPPRKPNLKAETAEQMLNLIKQHPGITCQEVATRLGRHISYIYAVRDILIDTKRIDVVREKRASGGGLSFSALYVKERTHGC